VTGLCPRLITAAIGVSPLFHDKKKDLCSQTRKNPARESDCRNGPRPGRQASHGGEIMTGASSRAGHARCGFPGRGCGGICRYVRGDTGGDLGDSPVYFESAGTTGGVTDPKNTTTEHRATFNTYEGAAETDRLQRTYTALSRCCWPVTVSALTSSWSSFGVMPEFAVVRPVFETAGPRASACRNSNRRCSTPTPVSEPYGHGLYERTTSAHHHASFGHSTGNRGRGPLHRASADN